MKNIKFIFVCDTNERFIFFHKLAERWAIRNVEFVCVRLSTYLKAKTVSGNAKFCGFEKIESSLELSDVDNAIRGSYEYRLDILNMEQCRRVINSICSALKRAACSGGGEEIYVVDWNGSAVHSIGVRAFGLLGFGKVVFVELSNLPGLFQFDCRAANGGSNLLTLSAIDRDKYISGLSRYICNSNIEGMIANQAKIKLPPQVKNGRSANVVQILDILYYIVSGYKVVRTSVFYRVFDRVLREYYQALFRGIYIHHLPDKFIFAPLQVSIDTNLVCWSSITNQGLIEEAGDIAIKGCIPLVIKIHPGERSGFELKKLYKAVKKYKFMVTTSSIDEVMKKDCTVVTINSSVGWQAICSGKATVALENTFYRAATVEQVHRYFRNALINLNSIDLQDFVGVIDTAWKIK